MIDIYYTFIIVENVLNSFIVLLALIYSVTILFVDRFRHVCNFFILNICLSISGSAIFLGIYFTIKYHFKENLFAPNFCILGWLIYALATIDMQFSFISFSIHRYCMVVYHRLTFFKSKTWLVLCIVIQWSFQCVVCLPFIFRAKPHCILPFWLRVYIFSFVAIVPTTMYTLINGILFVYLQASTRRLQSRKNSIFMDKTISQQKKISRRELTLLKRMIFNFIMLIGGWSPVFVVTAINSIRDVHPFVYHATVVICQSSVVAVVLNLLKCNTPVAEYLMKKLENCCSKTRSTNSSK